MLKTETLLTERPSSFSALINAESGDFLVSIFFPNQGAKGSLYFSSHHLPPTSIHLKALFMNKKQIINN